MNHTVTIDRSFRIMGLIWIVLISLFVITSCGSGPQKKDTKESAEDHNDAKFTSSSSEDDAQYLVDAYSIGLFEIEASQHAKQKATRKDVKDLAEKMISSHVKMNESLKSHADKKQVSLQKGLTEDQLSDIKSYDDQKGIEYDKAYLDKMIKGHEKAIKIAEEAADKAHDPEIRNLFNGALPDLRNHVEMGMSLKDKMH